MNTLTQQAFDLFNTLTEKEQAFAISILEWIPTLRSKANELCEFSDELCPEGIINKEVRHGSI